MTSYTASVLALVGSALLVGQIPGLAFKSRTQGIGANQCQNWHNTSSSMPFVDSHIESNIIQDCLAPSSLEKLNDSDVEEPSIFCRDIRSLSIGDTQRDCITWNPRHVLSSQLNPTSWLNAAHSLLVHFKGNNDLKLFDQTLTTWSWADVIKNYLLKESAPAILFPIASF